MNRPHLARLLDDVHATIGLELDAMLVAASDHAAAERAYLEARRSLHRLTEAIASLELDDDARLDSEVHHAGR